MSYSHSPYSAPPPASDGSPVSALVCAVLMTLCCNQVCGILAIVFAAIAMSKTYEPAEQERFLRYAWTTMGIGLAVTVVLVILYFLFIGAMVSTY